MNYKVDLKVLPERYVASVRKVIPSYEQEGDLWRVLMSETIAQQAEDDDPCYTLALFHDQDYKEKDVDVEVQKAVKGNYKDTKEVIFKSVPAIQMASVTYRGNYEHIAKAYEAVENWINDNDYELDGIIFNIYHVSPNETQNPEEWVTEVCYPVKKK